VLSALILNFTSRYFAKIAICSFVFVLGQISVSNLGVQQQILSNTRIQTNHLTVREYFDSETYSGLAKKLNRHPSNIRVLSFDLDPMIASYNGYTALDGYVYNYAVEYKNSFRKIIAGELAAAPSLRSYYDGWGSRVYLFHRNLPVSQIQINWCQARDMGTEFILSKVELGTVPNLKLAERYRGLSLYKISGCHLERHTSP
jgi:hypothetical protein